MAFEITEQFQRHVDNDRLIMLTTVTPTHRPAPRPVWFLWDGTEFVVFSKPDTAKLRHIPANPNVTLATNIGSTGGDTVVISGMARIVPDARSAAEVPEYVTRYSQAMARVSGSVEGFAASYSVPIFISPTKLWAIP
jgi:PPOX class probable F420-dependent enzyme